MSVQDRKDLLSRYHKLGGAIAERSVSLLAVSKYAPDEAVELLIGAGQRQFGESRAQHLRDRALRWPDCAWHMIGPLQRNKAKYVGRHAAMWHSCEGLEVAMAVAKYVSDRVLPVLIQVNLADTPGQHGVQPDSVVPLAEGLQQLPQLKLVGLMGMAPKQGDVVAAFRRLRNLRDALFTGSLPELDALQADGSDLLQIGQLCMGMSGDYGSAIDEGSTMVRLGSLLFGDWDLRLAARSDGSETQLAH